MQLSCLNPLKLGFIICQLHFPIAVDASILSSLTDFINNTASLAGAAISSGKIKIVGKLAGEQVFVHGTSQKILAWWSVSNLPSALWDRLPSPWYSFPCNMWHAPLLLICLGSIPLPGPPLTLDRCSFIGNKVTQTGGGQGAGISAFSLIRYGNWCCLVPTPIYHGNAVWDKRMTFNS